MDAEGNTRYTVRVPWKPIMSGSYVFREINDTRRQRAFITADVEYVGYGGLEVYRQTAIP